mmetsp:Transcript_47935/g.79653  ORF Transcript_47935/g.79653 Transcript_47935/m.79653 type:complete len:151 (+) Transcript_47935:494-946(+)
MVGMELLIGAYTKSNKSCDSLDGPLPSRHDASQVPSQKEAEGSDGDSGCDFTPSSPLHDAAFSAATSPPPSKKIRKPRSCKTCGHELSAKLAVGASGYTHVWDASARKFAPCECPAEFHHPSISRRRKKKKKQKALMFHLQKPHLWNQLS